MSCRVYRDLISRYIDDAVSQRERSALLEHLGHCHDCAALLARYRAIEAAFRKFPEFQPIPKWEYWSAPSMAQSVAGAVASSPRSGRPSSRKERLHRLRDRFDLTVSNRLIPRRAIRAPSSILAGTALTLIVIASFAVLIGSRSNSVGGLQSAPSLAGASAISAPLPEASGASTLSARTVNRSSVATLEQALMQTGMDHPVQIPLPRYIPVGMHLASFNLSASAGPGEIDAVEILYRDQNGNLLRIRRITSPKAPPISVTAKRTIVKGREWWIEQSAVLAPDGPLGYELSTRQNAAAVVLDAALPFDELMKTVESIDWTPEQE